MLDLEKWLAPGWGCSTDAELEEEFNYRAAQIREQMSPTGNLSLQPDGTPVAGTPYETVFRRLQLVKDRERRSFSPDEAPNPAPTIGFVRDSDRGSAETLGTARANLVSAVLQELVDIRQYVTSCKDLDEQEAKYPQWRIFAILKKHPAYREKVVDARLRRNAIGLAQELVAADQGVSIHTIRADWKKYKPGEHRRPGRRRTAKATRHSPKPKYR